MDLCFSLGLALDILGTIWLDRATYLTPTPVWPTFVVRLLPHARLPEERLNKTSGVVSS